MIPLEEEDLRKDNQLLARAMGFTEPFKDVNIQFKNDYILGVRFWASQYKSLYWNRSKEDPTEVIVQDIDKFARDIYIVPGLYDIPDSMKILNSKILNVHKSPEQLTSIFNAINRRGILTFEEGSDDSSQHCLLRYKDNQLSRNMIFAGYQKTLHLSKFEALVGYIKYRNNGDRRAIFRLDSDKDSIEIL